MTISIRAAELSADGRTLLETTWDKYAAAWPDWQPEQTEEAEAVSPEKFELKAGQLIYNSIKGDWR